MSVQELADAERADISRCVEALAKAKTNLHQAKLKRESLPPAEFDKAGVGDGHIQAIEDEIDELEKALENAGGYTYTLGETCRNLRGH